MAWSKAKTALVIGIGILITAATATVTVKEIQAHSTYPWQVAIQGGLSDFNVRQPPQVTILGSKAPEPDWAIFDGKLIGLGVPAQCIVASAYGFVSPTRATFSTTLPGGKYDYIACLPGGIDANQKALQARVKEKFGVVARIETRETDVWFLKVKDHDVPGLKPNAQKYGNALRTVPNGFQGWNESMPNFAYLLEDMARVPVIDQTGLTNRYDFDLNCNKNDLKNQSWDVVNGALGQLGLELVPGHASIDMLVVDRATD